MNPGPRTPSRLQIEPILESDRPSRPSASAPRPDRPYADRSGRGRSGAGYSGAGRSSSSRPFRGEGGLARPFTTSSGKPRAGGARPSSKPGAHTDRSSSVGWKPEKSSPNRSFGAGPSRGSAPRTIDPRTGSGYRPAAGPKRPLTAHPPGSSVPEQVHAHPVRPDHSLLVKAANPAPAARSPIPTPLRAPKDTAVPAGSPRPATEAPANQLQVAVRNRAASLNQATKANPPAPNGQVLPAERSGAKKLLHCLGGVAVFCFSRQPSAKRATMMPIHHCFAVAT